MAKFHEDEVKNQLLNELLALKGKKDAVSKERRRQLRFALRNSGVLSLPFSMNLKK